MGRGLENPNFVDVATSDVDVVHLQPMLLRSGTEWEEEESSGEEEQVRHKRRKWDISVHLCWNNILHSCGDHTVLCDPLPSQHILLQRWRSGQVSDLSTSGFKIKTQNSNWQHICRILHYRGYSKNLMISYVFIIVTMIIIMNIVIYY